MLSRVWFPKFSVQVSVHSDISNPKAKNLSSQSNTELFCLKRAFRNEPSLDFYIVKSLQPYASQIELVLLILGCFTKCSSRNGITFYLTVLIFTLTWKGSSLIDLKNLEAIKAWRDGAHEIQAQRTTVWRIFRVKIKN